LGARQAGRPGQDDGSDRLSSYSLGETIGFGRPEPRLGPGFFVELSGLSIPASHLCRSLLKSSAEQLMGQKTPEGMVTMAIRVIVGFAVVALVAAGAMAQSAGKSNPDVRPVVTALQEDLRMTLAAVDMQRQTGGALDISQRARDLLADYAK